VKPRHLGDSVHDLLDGRLRGDRAYAAMAHLGECEECAARFHELRTARDALNSSQAGIDMRFAQRLLDRDRIAEIAAHEDARKARVVRRRRRLPLIFAASSVVLLATVVVTAAWKAGEPDEVSLEFAQPRDTAVPVAYVDTQGMRRGELRSWIHPDFASSRLIPVDAQVVQRRNGQQVLVARILSGMTDITVVQQHGRLNDEIVDQLPVAEAGDAELYVLSDGPTSSVVWQTGDVVIALSCDCTLAELTAVAEEFPSADEPSFVERVSDGLEALADALLD